jgi:3(or 17)beta-hydroxysteroid dehydrogenase
MGRAIAVRLRAEGAFVVIADVDREAGAATAEEHDLRFIEHDVRDEAEWADVVSDVEARHGGLHVLVNNAGILGSAAGATPEDTDLSEWRAIFAVNVEGVFLGCRAALPAMRRAGGGAIINISSVASAMATPAATAYGASKAAVRQLTKSVAQYCAEQGLDIRCNSVHPGNVLTPLWHRYAEEAAALRGLVLEDILREGEAEVPLGGFTDPEDVAAAVAFLASDDARRITGVELAVDGGILHCDTFRSAFEGSHGSGARSDRRGERRSTR